MQWKTGDWFTSEWNFAGDVRDGVTFAPNIQLHDVTLRDGEQQAGVVFRYDEKIAIAQRLAELGIHRIEAGMPAVHKSDEKAIREIVKRKLGPKIFAFARCMKEDVDLAADCGVDGVIIEIPSSGHIIEKAYRWTLDRAIELSVEATRYAREKGLYTVFFPIDGTRADFDWFLRLITEVAENGHMDALGCVDTLGVLSPSSVPYVVRKIKAAVDKPVEVHFHDDFGMGSANTVLALAAGADVAHTTVSALGERAGNAAYEDVALSLLTMYGVDLGLDYGKLYETARFVREAAGVAERPNRGIMGPAISQIESGIITSWYKNAYQGDPLEVTPYRYGLTGHPEPEIVLGKNSGLASVELVLEQGGIRGTSHEMNLQLLQQVKDLSLERKQLIPQEEFLSMARNMIESQNR